MDARHPERPCRTAGAWLSALALVVACGGGAGGPANGDLGASGDASLVAHDGGGSGEAATLWPDAGEAGGVSSESGVTGDDAGDAWAAQLDAGGGDAGGAADAANGDSGGGDSGAPEVGCRGDGCGASPTSCEGLATACGPRGDEDCCASAVVSAGTFLRDYDGVTPDYTSKAYPATVSSFRLDRFEITIGRFRKFTSAWVGGWRPAAGAGKHTHLNQGRGLAAVEGGFEPGWQTDWSSSVPQTDADWDSSLSFPEWSAGPGADDTRPMAFATWYELAAFCIWDGGFLPSDAEWNYAAAGGREQRVYPWSAPATSTAIDCTVANFGGTSWPSTACVGKTNRVGSESPAGDGKWGQADLGGNVFEAVLDYWSASISDTCDDCTVTVATDQDERVCRGGGFTGDPTYLVTSRRLNPSAAYRLQDVGARCARAP